ncbi:protein SPT2 homolog [Acanthaster planci]|uniref:Protein SPT2 homolog n=1 Tax=Acanthaster planci TaxID=133434 RepID=A0A8B7Y7G7_ACAPL|nr:protein SPT2 homolog [Acanthaster planci]
MDFQKLLSIAARNNERAQKEVDERKRYSTVLPPPKKEKRNGVDQAAIRARLERKQQEVQQKASDEQAKKRQLLKLRAESNKKGKKSVEKPKVSGQRESDQRKHGYEDQKHEQKHQSFMKKIQKVAERTRKEGTEPVSKVAPDRPAKPKKPAPVQKGPMSYKQLLALAADQQNGGGSAENKPHTQGGTGADSQPPAEQSEPRNHRQDGMAAKKALATRKLEEARKRESHERRKSGEVKSGSGSNRKPQGTATEGPTSHHHRTNGKVAGKAETPVHLSSTKRPDTVTSKPATSTAKTKHSPAGTGKRYPITTDIRKNGAPNPNCTRQGKQELERKGRPAKLHQSRVEEYFEKKPAANRPRIAPPSRSPPRRQSKLDSFFDRASASTPGSSQGGSSRPQPGLERRVPPVGGQVPRKRPVPSSGPPPSFRAKRGRLLSEEESDYEDDGFIDDTPLEEGGAKDVSKYIKEIFGYDKSKYDYVSDYQLRNMEASFREIQKEEARTTRLGILEDLEDIRREREENRRLKANTATKKSRR